MKILVAADGSRYTKRMLVLLWPRMTSRSGPKQHRFTVLTVVAPVPVALRRAEQENRARPLRRGS